MTSVKMTAEFPLTSRAARFADRISEPGWWATNVERTGRTVTFAVEIPAEAVTADPSTVYQDYLESVGYHGSDERRKATLTMTGADGTTITRRAPACGY